MSTKSVRAFLSGVVVLGALGALLFTTMRESAEYYKLVDEVMSDPGEWYGKPMNLHGYVVDGSVERRPDTLDYRFKVQNGDFVVLASYTGILPDTFSDGAEVVLTGQLDPHGFQVAPKGVMAKCPSKYDPAQAPEGLAALPGEGQ
jgi:cytochrome c-type biogenesis protein CcmE